MENKMFCTKCKKEKSKKEFYKNQRKWCKNCRKTYQREHYKKKDVSAYMRKRYLENRDALIEYQMRYFHKNRDSVRKTQRKYQSKPNMRLYRNMSKRVHHVVRKTEKSQRWEELAGYSVEELKQHLESQFQPGMTWDNYGEWHIDHIIPVSVFNFDDSCHIDFKRCWALENLQPLWAKENISKGAKLRSHFQPFLKLKMA